MPKQKSKLTEVRTKEEQFSEPELDMLEELIHETTLWYCQGCGNWFESKEEILAHYYFSDDFHIENNVKIPDESFCRNVENGRPA